MTVKSEVAEETDMIVADKKGNELLDIIDVREADADKEYEPINHCLVVVKIGEDYLMGWNNWRKDWEIFGGCREENETLRECITRECKEELGLDHADFRFLGLMYYKMAPGYFNPEWHEEYGGLFGITLPKETLPIIEAYRNDKEEIEKLAFYRDVKGKEEIAVIDEKLLEYWK